MVLTTVNVDDNSKDYIDSDIDNSEDGSIAYITLTTGDIGDNNHSFDIGLIETYCIGDYIWLDEDKDGIQDGDEDSFTDDSVTIELLDENGNRAKDANGDEVKPITTTDGNYKFCYLIPDSYKIKVTPPDGYTVTIKDSGDDDAIDSDINIDSNESDLINLNEDDNLTIDIGLYKKTYCLGDFIWYDNDNDGIQDDGEEGVADVNITLYNSSNEELGTDTTDSGGKYEFCNLSSDDYYIVVDKSTLPDGYEITSQNQGDDDNNDSDINPDDGKSDTVTISDDNNYSLDGGIYSPT